MRGERRRGRRILIPALLFLFAFAVRSLPSRTVFWEGRVQPFDNDAFYHLRRIVYSIVNFPATLEFDPYMNFPDGAKAVWTPYLDWLIALAFAPFLEGEGLQDLERVAMWIPPLFGALSVLTLYFLALRFFGPAVALVSGLALSVMSGHFWYSQVGFLDHHAAVGLASTLALWAGMVTLDRDSRPAVERRYDFRASAATGITFAVAFLVWPGCLLHVAIIEVAFLVNLASRPQREEAAIFAGWIGWIHVIGFLPLLALAAPNIWPQWSRMSPVVLSGFQPWLFGALAVFGFLCEGLWRRTAAGRTRARRVGSAAVLASGLLVASGLALPDLPSAGIDAWQWMAKQDEFQAAVGESAPLFVLGGRFTAMVAASRLSLFFLLVPFALASGAWAVQRHPQRRPYLLFLWWTLALSIVTLFQKRFFNSCSVAVSLLLAWHAIGAYHLLPAWAKLPGLRRVAARTAVALGTLFLLAPVLYTYELDVQNQLRALRGESLIVANRVARRTRMVETARWLRKHTPETSGWMDSAARPEYGVLGPWTIGHVIKYTGRRPTVTDPFGDDHGAKNFVLARRYTQSREPVAVEILEELGVRYVVAQEFPAYLGEAPRPDSMFFSLFEHDGGGFVPEAPGLAPVKALSRHRLVYESQPVAAGRLEEPSAFKVYEFVPGALVEGVAIPRANVDVSVGLITNRRRPLEWSATVVTGPDGRFAVRVPYANEGSPPSVLVAPFYEFRSGQTLRRVVIHEAQVRGGKRVEGPDLRPSSGGG